tara:strand:- start:669 stop:1139 length:471 start_codon:yes stop_codon:yes gene_type:complete
MAITRSIREKLAKAKKLGMTPIQYSKYLKTDKKSKKSKKRKVSRPQAVLTIPKIVPAMRGEKDEFKKRNQSGDSIANLGKSIAGAFGKKKMPGLDNKMFKSVTGDVVGTEEAFADAELGIPDYDDAWMKKGGSIKKGMKKRKRAALRGGRKELRGA